jgi:hypothetical protein
LTVIHLIKDESLGGIERAYKGTTQRAEIGDYVYIFKSYAKVYREIGGLCQLEDERGKSDSWFEPDQYTALVPTDLVFIKDRLYKLSALPHKDCPICAIVNEGKETID